VKETLITYRSGSKINVSTLLILRTATPLVANNLGTPLN
jgi:hypothetical protein